MLTNRARLNLTVALAFPGVVLMGVGSSWIVALTQPWQLCVAAVVSGALLTALAFAVAPKDARRPRGGPMVRPETTIVLDKERRDADL